MHFFRLPLALFSLVWQSAFLALGQIWANKVRAVLTTIGIVIGVASVTAVIAALTGLKQNVLAEFESFGTNKLYVLPRLPEGDRRAVKQSDLRFTPVMFDGLLDHCPSVKTFTRQTSGNKTISYGTRSEANVGVTGIDPPWHEIENRSIVLGRPFSLVDNEQGRAVCLINAKLQEQLALPRDPTGESVLIGDRRYLVVGVVESRSESSMFGGNQNGSECLVPFNTLFRRDAYMHVVAACRSPEVADEARAEIAFYLRKRRQLKIGDPDNFRIEVVEQYVQKFKSVASAITLVAGGVVGISLLVGGVGIMNIMLVSVSERTREIGLRKAVGARPSAILLQFLVEAMMLCLLGGLMGVLCGEGLTRLLASFPAARLGSATIPAWAVAVSFGFAAAVGLIFGMFPAIKAARLDPIDALRHE